MTLTCVSGEWWRAFLDLGKYTYNDNFQVNKRYDYTHGLYRSVLTNTGKNRQVYKENRSEAIICDNNQTPEVCKIGTILIRYLNYLLYKMMMKKFRGCMLGALLGDCFGSPYEFIDTPVSKAQLQSYFDKLEGPPFKTPLYQYTDDTAMTKSVAESLVQHNAFNAHDMAEKFVKEYSKDPRRGYGMNVVEVFRKLNVQNLSDLWAPAAEQFGGSGSYGNGGAMRISPVPLFAHNDYDKMIEIAEKSTKLTHTHPLGINGAILQAIAIYLAVKCDPETPLDIGDYLKELLAKITDVENRISRVVKDDMSYCKQLGMVQKLLEMKDQVTTDQVVDRLGHDVSAVGSVPTAIYCFLRAQQPIPEIITDNPFRRTIQYAISLGGDTDTIASMAGAIAGGYYGVDMINENLLKLAEGQSMIDSLATRLYENVAS